MRVSMTIRKPELDKFNARLDATVSKLGNGSKKALTKACEEIMADSVSQVPTNTGTLKSSAYYTISGSSKTRFTAELGYGGNGNPINPISGEAASDYMVAVHENLRAVHPNGKAKFLEDPIQEYARERFHRTVIQYASEAIGGD